MRVLVAHASVHGATAEIGQAIADELARAGHETEARDAAGIEDLSRWDAAIVGGALYAAMWPRRARRFVARHADELERMPVWLFSSGPLGVAAKEPDPGPTSTVARAARAVRARGHVTFGGRLDPEARTFPASALAANGMGGDFRDMGAVRDWAREIAAQLDALGAPSKRPTPRAPRALRRVLATLTSFTGLTALAGGVELALWPHGAPWAPWLDPRILEGSPFTDFFVPGVLLAAVVGALNALSAWSLIRRTRHRNELAFVAGGAITVWILVELALLPAPVQLLQMIYLVTGIVTQALAVLAWLTHRRLLAARGRDGLGASAEPMAAQPNQSA